MSIMFYNCNEVHLSCLYKPHLVDQVVLKHFEQLSYIDYH